jgi:glucose-6-phosphate isomerase
MKQMKSNRLGWLNCPDIDRDSLEEILQFVQDIIKAGFKQALLLGMGGSSLAPEVFRYTFGVSEGFLDLAVLDSTDPAAVIEAAHKLDFKKTLFIVSTKSGGTVETTSFMKYFYQAVSREAGVADVGSHFIAITDPGSGLESIAKNLKFRKIFLNDPEIGGRYSALSHFGLVPAALIGIDIEKLLERSGNAARQTRESVLPELGRNSAAWLGAIIGGLEKLKKDKLTLVTSADLKHFGAWIEQLIAESTGKNGKGVLPVDLEDLATPDHYLNDRIFIYIKSKGKKDAVEKNIQLLEQAGFPVVRLTLDDIYDLGGEIFRWETATAIAGSIMEINPFNQPNVESAKIQAREMMSAFKKKGALPELPLSAAEAGIQVSSADLSGTFNDILQNFLNQLQDSGDTEKHLPYVAIQAYMKPSAETDNLLGDLRIKIRNKYKVATTVGYGPRFLHSTGQLHKGGYGNGLFIQLFAEEGEDCPIPDQATDSGSTTGFRILKRAQALGDRQALLDANRKVLTFDLHTDAAAGIRLITAKIKAEG